MNFAAAYSQLEIACEMEAGFMTFEIHCRQPRRATAKRVKGNISNLG